MSVIRNVDRERREEILAEVKAFAQRLRLELGATRVILFGSFARGRVHEGSDIDLVVVARVPGRAHERVGVVRDMTELPIEPLVFSPEDFERLLATPSSIVAEAVRTGVDL